MTEDNKTPWMVLGDELYNRLKWLTMIVLPAFATLYLALSIVWGLPKGNEVVATVTALVTFLGIVLGISTMQYNNSGQKFDGAIDVQERGAGEPTLFSLVLDSDPNELVDKDQVTFRVNR